MGLFKDPVPVELSQASIDKINGLINAALDAPEKVYIIVNFYGFITAVFADKDKSYAHLSDGDEVQEWEVT